jgi:hydrogenase maturation factor HypF (carbamoyltransferase family)
MEKYYYFCHYCGKEYIPKRRRIQKYCCKSCKNNEYNLKKKNNLIVKTEFQKDVKNSVQIEKMSIAGVGNTVVGTLAANLVSNLLTSEGNKPATKNDIKNLTSIIKNRYHPIKNIPNRNDGAVAFYDFEKQIFVYLKTQTK